MKQNRNFTAAAMKKERFLIIFTLNYLSNKKIFRSLAIEVSELFKIFFIAQVFPDNFCALIFLYIFRHFPLHFYAEIRKNMQVTPAQIS